MRTYLFAIVGSLFLISCGMEEIPTYKIDLTVSPSEGGKLILSPSLPMYPEGSTVTITPEPNEHWVFKQWEGDGSGSSTPLQLTMDSNKSVVGVFVKRDYPLKITITGEGTVEEKIVPNPGEREYPHGTTVELTPKPKEGWVFESWGGDLTGTETPKSIKVDKEKNVIVKFKRRDYPLNITITGEGTVEEKIITNPGGKTYPFETVVELTPKPKEGWVFESWGGDLTGTETPKTIKVDKEKNVTVNFKRRDYPLNITITGEGTVEEKIIITPGGRSYPFETVVELTPKPKEGWEFESWGGDLTGTETPKTIKVDKEKNVNIKFKLSPIFKLGGNGITCVCENVTAGSKGMINGVEYEAVDNNLIRIRKSQGVDMTKLCTSLVTDLSDLFKNTLFNQNIENWDVSNVTNMTSLFSETPFNQPIGSWDVGKVTKMDGLFSFSLFNKSISNWNVSNVTSMNGMFAGTPFNHPIGNWNVSSVKSMAGMFINSKFNQNIGSWNVKNVLDMSQMFESNTEFNQAIGSWNVSSVTNMNEMFTETPFNQSLENWDVSNVTSMGGMFRNTPFNQRLENWNVSKVKKMDSMFSGSLFSQNISGWCVELIFIVPQNFSSNIPDSFKPVWGTCPD